MIFVLILEGELQVGVELLREGMPGKWTVVDLGFVPSDPAQFDPRRFLLTLKEAAPHSELHAGDQLIAV